MDPGAAPVHRHRAGLAVAAPVTPTAVPVRRADTGWRKLLTDPGAAPVYRCRAGPAGGDPATPAAVAVRVDARLEEIIIGRRQQQGAA